MNKASWVYNLNGDTRGIMRTLAPGIEANIFPGENVMLSVVRIEAHAQGTVHAHPEEQWGVLLEGKCTRSPPAIRRRWCWIFSVRRAPNIKNQAKALVRRRRNKPACVYKTAPRAVIGHKAST